MHVHMHEQAAWHSELELAHDTSGRSIHGPWFTWHRHFPLSQMDARLSVLWHLPPSRGRAPLLLLDELLLLLAPELLPPPSSSTITTSSMPTIEAQPHAMVVSAVRKTERVIVAPPVSGGSR